MGLKVSIRNRTLEPPAVRNVKKTVARRRRNLQRKEMCVVHWKVERVDVPETEKCAGGGLEGHE